MTAAEPKTLPKPFPGKIATSTAKAPEEPSGEFHHRFEYVPRLYNERHAEKIRRHDRNTLLESRPVAFSTCISSSASQSHYSHQEKDAINVRSQRTARTWLLANENTQRIDGTS